MRGCLGLPGDMDHMGFNEVKLKYLTGLQSPSGILGAKYNDKSEVSP
jgi:hypothetical protein